MISLADYYQPLNWQMLVVTALVWVFLDIIGFSFATRFIRLPDWLRPVNWLIGLGLFVLTWFGLHFWLPFRPDYILLSAVPWLVVCLPYYVRHCGFETLVGVIKDHPWPLVIALPLLPAVWVKASLPPYYFDEMAYQYLSPYTLKIWSNWDFFSGGLYQNLPRQLNILWYLIFGLTKTYAPARLLHFLIYFSGLWAISRWLGKNINVWAGVALFALFLYLPQDVLTSATLGYVDIGAIFTASLGAITFLDFLINRRPASLLAAGIFWGLSVGIKNTTLTSLASFSVVSLFFLKRSILNRRLVLSALTLFLLFGGYWYVKNLILFYNPLYPFVFPCKAGLAETCGRGTGFFTGWMQPITRATFPNIFSDLMANSRPLVILFIVNLLLLLFQKNRKILLASGLILLAVAIELLLLKYTSGYKTRYHQHLQIYLMLLLALQVVKPVFSLRNLRSLMLATFSLVLGFIIARQSYRFLRFTYTPNYLQPYEVQYALGKMTIRDWIAMKFPRMKDVVFFCETPPEGKVFTLSRLDPDLIWFEYDGMMRTFMTNCTLDGISISGTPMSEAIDYSVKNKLKYYLISLSPCTDPAKIIYTDHEAEYQRELRRLNNEVVCHSREILPHLYLFDWRAV